MIYRCLIVEDEPPAIKVLTKYLESIEYIEIVGVCNNALQAMDFMGKEEIDVLFLDIQMPKVMGTTFIKALPIAPKVIFTTAHSEFAAEAFELDAVDYLLKPISYERFLRAINKLLLYNKYNTQESIISQPRFLYFRTQRKMVKVILEDILYIESLKDYIAIHREDQPKIIVKLSMGMVENMLPKNSFLRIHRSFIVALEKVTAFTQYDVEIGNLELPIGRSYMNVHERLMKNP